MKTTLRTLFIILLAAFAFSCEEEAIHVERVNLNSASVTLFEQDTYQLVATVSPSNAANGLILWSSDNSSVASVANGGLVTAVAPGIAKIIATSDEFGRTAECLVTVLPRNASSITLDASDLTLHEREQYILKPALEPENADASTLVWESSDAEVASVSSGVILALRAGTAVISVSSEDGKAKAECAVTVICDVIGVKLENHSFSLKIGETIDLAPLAHVYPDRATNKAVTWASSNTRVASVSDEGKVTAVASGSAEITVTAADGGHSDTCVIEVDIADMVLDHTTLDMVVEDEADLHASEPSGVPVTGVSWSSTDPGVASVDQNGHVVALSAGSAVICATTLMGGHHAFCTVSVRNKVDKITMSKKSADMLVGDSGLALSVELDPKEAAEYVKIVWSSSDETVATVDQDGNVTAVGSGTAVITASTTDGKVSDKCTVSVKQPVTTLSLSPESQILWIGEELGTVTVTLGPDNADVKDFNVDYSNTASKSIVKFSVSGQTITVEPLKVGKAKLDVTPTSRLGILYKSFEVEVRAHVESVSIEGDESRLMNVGDTDNLTAAISPSDAFDQTVTWSSSNTGVVTVDSKGKVTAKASGTSVITVTTRDGSKTDECTITVAQPVSSVTLNKEQLTFTEGDPSQALVATILPKDADHSVTWSSDKPTVAIVDDEGNVSPVSAGTAVITAQSSAYPDKKATCSVTVNAKIIHVESVELSPATLDLLVGETHDLGPSLKVLPEKTSQGVDRTVTWRSSMAGVASVNDYGMVTAISAGTTTITCTSKDNTEAKAVCEVTVSLPPVAVESITLSKTSATLSYNSTLRLVATIYPEDATNQEVTWKSSNTSVATVSADGLVTALSKTGSAVITVSSVDDSTIQAECSISVIPQVVNPSGISISPRYFSIYVGQTKTIQGTVSPSNVTDKSVIWEAAAGAYIVVTNVVMSNNSSVAYVRGNKAGNTNLEAKTSDGKYTTTAIIEVLVNEVASIETSHPNGITLKLGESFDLTATPIGADRTVDPSYPTLRWTQSGNVVSVTSTGHVVATNAGTGSVIITSVYHPNVTATIPVTVIDPSAGDNGHEGVGFDDWNFN